MHLDVAIIGAGMSGLAAGIRLAQYDRRVCIFERHYAYGGLNSYYRLDGRDFDVGLHALTNYVPADQRHAALNRVLRQLRIAREELDLRPQRTSSIRFGDVTLRFGNAAAGLLDAVAAAFPAEVDGVRRLIERVRATDLGRVDPPEESGRAAVAACVRDPMLADMLMIAPMYYGCAAEHDMPWHDYAIIFTSVLLEGMCRPREGVRAVVRALVRRYRACGGKLRMRCGVQRVQPGAAGRPAVLTLDDGEEVTADAVLSSAGLVETLRLCGEAIPPERHPAAGRVSFVESITLCTRMPAELGNEDAVVFFNEAGPFTYAVPGELLDPRSGVLCCPNNYEGHEDMPEGVVRVTSLANPQRWAALEGDAYARAKAEAYAAQVQQVERMMPGMAACATYHDVFTPRTIERYTGHVHGAVYGSPVKRRDARTPYENVFLCGTDQGYLGIVGALLSGVTVANVQVLGV